jgi:hypothetical protein
MDKVDGKIMVQGRKSGFDVVSVFGICLFGLGLFKKGMPRDKGHKTFV